ncbi:MAG TPA: hypothetical protein VGG75_14245 [Trebonia sp.]
MTALWDLLPPAIVTRAKAIVAVIGVTGFIVVSFFPSLATDHYVAAAIAVLTALGVWGVPNQNAKTERPVGLRHADGTPYVYKEKRRHER